METTLDYKPQEIIPADTAGIAYPYPEGIEPQSVFSDWDAFVSEDDSRPQADGVGSPTAVFGSGSRLETTKADSVIARPLSENRNELYLDGLLLFLFFYFFIFLYRHRGAIHQLLRSFVMPGHFDALINEQSVAFRLFVRSSSIMSFAALLTIALQWGMIWDEASVPVVFPDQLRPYWLPLLALVFASVFLYKRIIWGIIAVLNGKDNQVAKIRTFNGLFVATVSLLLVPVAFLCGAADQVSYRWLFIFELIVLVIIVLAYVFKSFSFFTSRKIPLLQWILYLCAVEIWPVSFYVLFAARGFEW